MYYTYILQSISSGKLYIGQTQNLQLRLEKHNKGYNKSTKSGRPWKIIFSVSFETRKKAMKLERKLKNFKSRKRIFEFIKNK